MRVCSKERQKAREGWYMSCTRRRGYCALLADVLFVVGHCEPAADLTEVRTEGEGCGEGMTGVSLLCPESLVQ